MGFAGVKSHHMKTQITFDTGGRVLIPKELRDRLGVGPGDVLELSEASEQITFKPVCVRPCRWKNGMAFGFTPASRR